MSLPIPKGILGTPRRFTPRKGLVSVALVLLCLYELWTERRVLPAWHSVGARTFLHSLTCEAWRSSKERTTIIAEIGFFCNISLLRDSEYV